MPVEPFSISDHLEAAIASRDQCHSYIQQAFFHDPAQAAVDYACINRKAMGQNSWLHSLLTEGMPFGDITAQVAGGVIGAVAVGEGGTREGRFLDSHTHKATVFFRAVAKAAGVTAPEPTDLTTRTAKRLYPNFLTLANSGLYAPGSTDWFLEMLGRCFASEFTAARATSGRDEFGLVAGRFQERHPEIWGVLSKAESAWLLEHTGEEESGSSDDTLEDEHLGYVTSAVNMAASYVIEQGQNQKPEIAIMAGVDHWTMRLENFFAHWATL